MAHNIQEETFEVEVDTLEEEWGDEFTLRRYHDQALSYGSPPVKFIRALMLGEDIPQSGK